MNLTLNALNKVKDTCEKCTALESLFAAENEMELFADIQNLNASVDSTMRLLDDLQDAMKHLKVNGYSDEWFDSLNKDGALEGLVTFEMPKFFDGPAGRAQACQEGFIETIKEWIIKGLKFVLDLLNKVMDWRFKIMKIFDNRTWKEKAEELDKKIGALCVSEAARAWFEAHSIKAEGFYDSNKMRLYVGNTIVLLQAIKPNLEEPFNEDIISSSVSGLASLTNVNTLNLRKEFIVRLQKTLNSKGVKYNNVKNDGMELKFDPTGSKYVKFIGLESGTDLPKKDVEFFSVEELQKAVGEEMSILNVLVDSMNANSTDIYYALRKSQTQYSNEYNQLRKDPQTAALTEERQKVLMISVGLTQCALAVVMQTQKFIDKCNAVCQYNQKVLQAIADDIAKKPKP